MPEPSEPNLELPNLELIDMLRRIVIPRDEVERKGIWAQPPSPGRTSTGSKYRSGVPVRVSAT